ncbi:hypothetical protein BBJ28_00017272 [Nothophytophthora sp. Chile5]|nr:hypothetical protein BBJ28_00017272 [Nothophytophthora sp. Chile5]
MPVSVTAVSAINNKLRVFQESELHDEYYRLLDAETELKASCLVEQQKCVNAIARARRLEEIMMMKDKKIESLLHGKAIGSDRGMGGNGRAFQREMAQRDRQSHALAQKLRLKSAQQSRLLSSYEEAMHSLRSGIKTTNAMELEEERNQLYLELLHQQELLARQRLEREAQEQKVVAFVELDAINKLNIVKLQQENKAETHARQKLEQEIEFLQSRVEQLQSDLTREQRKRTYDREFGENRSKQNASSSARGVLLAQALEEMKTLMRKESNASSQRGKLKSPMPASTAPRADKSATEGAMADQDGPSAASPQPGQKGSCQEDSASFAAVGEAGSNRSTVEEVIQGVVDASTIEDLAEIQRQKIAAIGSMLRLDAYLDDDLESELSADLLDDAQHPMLKSNGDDDDVLWCSDSADIELVGGDYQQQDTAEESIDEDRVSSALQQDFDAMYPSDFADTDAPSLDNEQEDNDGEDDDEDDGEMADAAKKDSQ